ncbi:Polygalacturonase [Alteromonadaceae bacterium Bs31]|nr:Polygalacturonase [Alteromonadaceae bacterium Bs31]
MKIIIPLLFLSLFVSFSSAAAAPEKTWKTPEQIVAEIELPKIPNKDFYITDFGAKPGKDARPAIVAAIDEAVKQGGGRVILPKGKWKSNGPVHLKSRINLHLQEGAHLLFSEKPKFYLPVVKVRWEGTEVYTYSPLIYAANVTDVAITGKGVIDGNAKSHFKRWHKKQWEGIDKLRSMGFNGVPVEERVFGEGTYLRPDLIQFFHAERVLLEDYTTHNSPFWVNHLVYTKHATVRNLNVDSHFPNNDGLDIESSELVLVEDCLFRTGDDSVVVKSGRDLDGRTIGIPSKDIVVRRNDMGGEDGIGLGSEMSGGISNVYFLDNVLREGDTAFRFKSNLDRGGVVEHIVVRNFQVENFGSLFWFQLNYPSKLGGNFPSTYKDIVIENVVVENVSNFLEIHAPATAPLQDVLFKDIIVKKAENYFDVENAVDLTFENVNIAGQVIDGNLSWRKAATQ